MQRYTRITLALLLGAGMLGGTVGASQTTPGADKYRMVQQSGQTAQDQMNQPGSQPGERSTGIKNRAESDTSRIQEQAGEAANRMSGAAGQAADQAQQAGQQAQQSAQSAMGGGQQFMPGQLPQGFQAKNFDNATKDVRQALGSLTQAVLKKDNYNDLIDHFAQSDRDRLKTSEGDSYGPQLNQAIDQLQAQWQTKYKGDLAFNADQAFGDQALSVTTGQVSNPDQIQNWPMSLTSKGGKQYGKPSMNRDTNIGVATLNAGNDNYNVSMIREGNDWKIDIPDTLNADRLKTNLARHLSQVSQMANQWPQDWVQAQRVVASHILMALYDVDAQQQGAVMGQQQGQQGQQPPQQQGAQQDQQRQRQEQQKQQIDQQNQQNQPQSQEQEQQDESME